MTRSRRAAFTLIELLTVISIMVILMGMIVGVAYTNNSRQVANTGATTLLGWLKTAQAYALRDQKPYGVRLNGSASGNFVTAAQFIEQPMEWVGPMNSTITASATVAGGPITITGVGGVDFTGGGTNPILGADFLECKSGQIAVITSVGGATTLNCQMQAGDSVAMWNFSGMADWRIVRQPRAMIGSDLLGMPGGAVIDILTNSTYSSPLPPATTGNNYDIVFSSTGAVISPGLSGRDIHLWVIDSNQNSNQSATTFTGDQYIVTIAVRTGLISIHPVDITAGGSGYANPYSFTQDGRSSGF